MDTQKPGSFVLGDLADEVVRQMRQAGFRPTMVMALARGGFKVAAEVAKRLGIQGDSVVGVPVQEYEPGKYRIAVWFAELTLMRAICSGRVILVIDDSSISGMLANGVAHDCVNLYGALDARSCVLIASTSGLPSNFVGAPCEGKPPKFQ